MIRCIRFHTWRRRHKRERPVEFLITINTALDGLDRDVADQFMTAGAKIGI